MLAGILHLSSQRGLYFAGFTLLPKLETAVIDSFAKQWYKLKILFNCFFCTEGYQPHLLSNQWDLYLLISSETLRNIKPGTVERKNHAEFLLQSLVIGRIQSQMSLGLFQLSVVREGQSRWLPPHPPITFFSIWPKKPHTAMLAAATTLSKGTLEEKWSFNDFLFLAFCHCPLKHLCNMEVGSKERETAVKVTQLTSLPDRGSLKVSIIQQLNPYRVMQVTPQAKVTLNLH